MLIHRGLIISNREKAENFLAYCNYYRFTGYIVPFESKRDSILQNVTFEDVCELYEFDHQLRMLIFKGIAIIEIFARTKIAYYFATCDSTNSFGHLKKELFFRKNDWEECHRRILEETKRSKEHFITHYQSKYRNWPELPPWIMTEILSFGTLSTLYSCLHYEEQRKIAREFQVHHKVLGSWLHSLSTLRNACAHYSRIWNREMSIKPKIPDSHKDWSLFQKLSGNEKTHCTQRVFLQLSIINYLLKIIESHGGMKSSWQDEMVNLITKPPKSTPLFQFQMGIPQDWETSAIWNNDSK